MTALPLPRAMPKGRSSTCKLVDNRPCSTLHPLKMLFPSGLGQANLFFIVPQNSNPCVHLELTEPLAPPPPVSALPSPHMHTSPERHTASEARLHKTHPSAFNGRHQPASHDQQAEH